MGMFEHTHIFFVNNNKKSKNSPKYNDKFKHTRIIFGLCGCVETYRYNNMGMFCNIPV